MAGDRFGDRGVVARIQDPDDFIVQTSSELAGDDACSSPYHLSHCARWCLNAGVDHLHALKTLVIDSSVIHSSADYSLARGALENFGAGFWLLHPPDRRIRVERAMRWWAKNFKDQSRATKGMPNETPLAPKLDKLVDIARAADCDLKRIRDGYTSSEALQYADQYSLARRPYLIWQVCSGFAHGRPWANIGMNAMEKRSTADEGVSLVRLTTDYKRLLGIAWPATRLMEDFLRLYQDRAKQAP